MVREYIPSKHTSRLGSLGSVASRMIKQNEKSIASVLKKARLNGLGSSKEILTVDESITLLNKDNGLMNDDEIRAWVWYKRSLGIPMKGWERYFLKEEDKDTDLAISICETEIKDKHFKTLKVVPEGTELGAIVANNDHDGYTYFTDKSGDLRMVASKNIKHHLSYSTSQKNIDKMVKDGVLFYNNGRYLPFAVYVYANSYDRELELKEDEELIKNRYGQKVFENHERIIRSVRPKPLSFLDPIKENRPFVSPFSEFAKSFEIVEVSESATFEVKESLNLCDAYYLFLSSNLSKDMFDYPAINGWDIIGICYNNNRMRRGGDKEAWELYRGRCYQELNRLFVVFIEMCLTFKDKQRLDIDWNRRFNGFPAIQSNKVPIGLPMSKIVRGGQFELRPAQREGVAFLELSGSGCVSFDVGVGKTFTAIAEVACAMSQGRCSRPLVVVPNSTYHNWIMEFVGKGDVKGLLSGTGYKINEWYNLGTDVKAKENDIKDNTITLVTKEGLMKLGFGEGMGELVTKDLKAILCQATQNADSKTQAKFDERIDSLMGRGQKGSKLDFDKCGFDYIVIDEAHNYKNIFSKIHADTSKKALSFHQGGGEASDAGLKAFICCNYIQRKFGGNVMLLTATPFTNTPLEIFSMLSLVALDELHKRNIENVHTFFETFVNEEYDEVVDASLNIRNDYVVKSFKNRLILQGLIYANFDYKTGEEAGVQRPNKINIPLLYSQGKMLDKDSQILSYLKMNDRQELNQKIINFLINKAGTGSSKGSGKGGDSVLSGMGSSLNNALSPFLFKVPSDVRHKLTAYPPVGLGLTDDMIDEINREPADYEEFIEQSPKIGYACECIKSIKKWHEDRKEEMSGQVIYSNRGKEYFEYIKTHLENICNFKKGIQFKYITNKERVKKVDEVEIVSGGISTEEKDVLMQAFNEGVIKVIIGTATIKEGVNLQKRSTCLYDLYPDWNPTDVQQLEGRIYRQGNKYQFVRVVLPLMQNSMDTFVFQKLQEKTDRVNDIWYKADRGNVLSVDSLDPKEVKFALITDINQLVAVEIKKEAEKLEREKSIINEELTGVNNFKYNYENLKRYREKTLKNIRDSLNNLARYNNIISNRPTEDELKEMTADERNKAIRLLERYDELMMFINQSSFPDDKEIVAMSRKLANIYYMHSTFSTDNFAEAIKNVKKIEDSVLVKRGYNRDSDINKVIEDLKLEIAKINVEIEDVTGQEHFLELYNYIAKKKREMNIVGKSIYDRINEFTSTNYVMQYAFTPLANYANNTLPPTEPSKVKEGGTQSDDKAKAKAKAIAIAMRIRLLKL